MIEHITLFRFLKYFKRHSLPLLCSTKVVNFNNMDNDEVIY